MRLVADEALKALARLNAELERLGDSARVRYAAIEPDPDFDGELLLLATWEFPSPPGSDETWPLAELDR